MENIKNIFETIKIITAIIGGLIANLLGGYDAMLKFLIGLMVVDYLLGISAAIFNNEINSKKGFKGIAKKIFMLIPIGIAYQLDILFNTSEMLRYTAIVFYIVNESFSIIENLGKAGVPIPMQIRRFLEQLNEESEG